MTFLFSLFFLFISTIKYIPLFLIGLRKRNVFWCATNLNNFGKRNDTVLSNVYALPDISICPTVYLHIARAYIHTHIYKHILYTCRFVVAAVAIAIAIAIAVAAAALAPSRPRALAPSLLISAVVARPTEGLAERLGERECIALRVH